MTDAPIKVIRLKVRCDDETQFKRELAARIANRLFVPTDAALVKDTLFALHLKFNDGLVHVRGTARVVKAIEGPRKGVHAKYVSLEPDSIQFPLDFAPFDESGPISNETLQPAPTGEHPVFTPPAHEPENVPVIIEAPPPLAPPVKPEWSGGLRPLDVLGNYQLLDRLGSGGMAEVYAARATMGGGVEKIVALKVVLPEFGPGTPYGGLFLNEAKISASLQHPSLIQVFDFGEAQGRPYLAMEYVRGRDLASVLQVMRVRGIKPTVAFAVHVVLEVVKALAYLHQRTDVDGRPLHLVHRDVSPGNIVLSENGEVKLVDFGVAAEGPLAQKQLVAGKFSYMPPEQVNGQSPSPSWDLYAAGMVLYELLTLQPLFEGTTSEGVRAGKREPVRPPSEVNPDVNRSLDELVLRATSLQVERRFGRAEVLIGPLEAVLRETGRAKIGPTITSLFETDLDAEKKRLDAAVLQARAAKPTVTGQEGGLIGLRRSFSRSSLGKLLARRPVLGRVLAVVLAVAAGAGAFALWGTVASANELNDDLQRFDERIASGALSGPGGDTALDWLAKARTVDARDGRVRARAEQLAKVFELLAEKALTRGDDPEAAVHLQALLLADPSRPGVAAKLKETEDRVRGRSHPK